MFDNKVLMITGGTGSFGNAVLRRFLHTGIREIRIFSRDEKKQDDMRTDLRNPKLKFILGDVRDYGNVREAMAGVDYVFHAAALKQVPSCEFYPMEALRTNVVGTENVLQAAIEMGANRVVLLSTDKAVYPVNAMGLSKALAEKVVLAKSRVAGNTIACITRYGNVMGSRGSVIPLFIQQIKSGLPVTVTDPKMTRFLMSLEDSVELVVHAYLHSRSGDIFVQKAPAASIGNLAQAIRELFNSSSPVKVIGTRHGEKLFETLIAREEIMRATHDEHYYRIPADNRDLNYDKFFVQGELELSSAEDYTSHNTDQLGVEAIKERLRSLDFVQRELAS